MKPLIIDFAPAPPPRGTPSRRIRWLVSGIGALLLVVSISAWMATAPVEASRMTGTSARPLPDAAAAEAVDAAVRELNLPWLAAIDALASTFGRDQEAALQRMDTDMSRGVIRLTGATANAAVVQALPARLRASGPFDGATLVSQTVQEGATGFPVQFVIELTLREGP